MPEIIVCPTARAAALIRERSPSHVVGIASPGAEELRMPDLRFIHLAFNDIAEPRPGLVAPDSAAMAALIAFGGDWTGERPLLIHCQMGVSRSPAAALILACARREAVDEEALAAAMRAAAPCATPNPMMISLADDLLDRGGHLVDVVRAMGRGEEYRPQLGFSLMVAAA